MEKAWKSCEKSSLPPKVFWGLEKGKASLTKRQFHCSTEIESAVCSLSRKEDQHRNDDGDARKFPFVTVADLVIRIL